MILKEGIEKFSTTIESNLCQNLLYSGCGGSIGGEETRKLGMSVTLPSHFFGELTKTPYGCSVLKESGHFIEWCKELRAFKHSQKSVTSTKRIKSILWTMSQIGVNDASLQLLTDENIVQDIVSLAQNCTILSIRGYLILFILFEDKGCLFCFEYSFNELFGCRNIIPSWVECDYTTRNAIWNMRSTNY